LSHNPLSRILVSFLILNIVTGTVGGAMQIAVPSFALDLHATTAEIGLIRGVAGIGILLLVIPAGLLVDHFGARSLFILGSFGNALITFTLSLAGAPLTLIVLQGVLGLFAALKITALNAAFFARVSDMGLSRAGWFRGSMSIGLTFVGPLLGGFLDERLASGHVFQTLGWLALAPTALVLFFHREPKPVRRGSLREGLVAQLHELRGLLASRDIHFGLLTESISTGCFATFSAFVVVLAVTRLNAEVGAASILMTIEGGAFIVVVFAVGSLITRLSREALFLLSFAVSSAGLVALALSETFVAAAAGSGVLGIGLGLFNLVTASQMGRLAGDKGKVVSLFGAAMGIGASLGPILAGLIGNWFGTPAIFLSFIPLMLLPLVPLALRPQANVAAIAAPAKEYS
jgi:MFS family permease